MLSPFAGLLTVAPALVAIAVALITRRAELALLLGVVLGALVASGGAPVDALLRFGSYLASSLGFTHGAEGWDFSVGHLEISLFSVLVAITVGVMGKAGGTRALIQRVEGLAGSRRGAMVSTWLAGVVVFFDDYANCLVVGSAMGPMCDRYRVSREKLAYIVDSTAAPVASLALVSTWVGYEVGLIEQALSGAGVTASAFSVFLASIPYRFYSIFTLVFVGVIAISGRDFGPMHAAESRAQATTPTRADPTDVSPLIAVIPVSLLVACTLGWLVVDGTLKATPNPDHGFWMAIANRLGSADPYHAMLFGSAVALAAAVVGTLASRALKVPEISSAAVEGARTIGHALIVLFLAWALGAAMEDTGAATWISGLLDGHMPASLLPAVTFILAGCIAFATGTSFGTMAILIPIALPVAVAMSPDPFGAIVLGSTAAVLAGSCLGDHASPISDTTVLSSVGAGVSLVEHVRTQLPYALTTGAIAVVFGYLPIGLGAPLPVLLLTGSAACVAVVWALGRPPTAPSHSR